MSAPALNPHGHNLREDWSRWLATLQPSGETQPARRRLIGAAGLAGLGTFAGVSCGGGGGSSPAPAPVIQPPAPQPPASPTPPAPSPAPPPPASPPPPGPGAPAPTPAAPAPAGACAEIPNETAGPFPADGTNGPNVLTTSGILRRDIRASVGTGSAVAQGVPLTVVLNLRSASACGVLANYAVYLWHCDALGRYSLYNAGVTTENYLRGVQTSDASGQLSFVTVFPGCYSGRWPHIHFEIFSSLAAATSGRSAGKTSQLALPQAPSDAVYATSAYTGSAANLRGITLASDGIFSDGVSLQLASVTGDVARGFTATLQVNVPG